VDLKDAALASPQEDAPSPASAARIPAEEPCALDSAGAEPGTPVDGNEQSSSNCKEVVGAANDVDATVSSPLSATRNAPPAEESCEGELCGREPGAIVDCDQQISPRHEEAVRQPESYTPGAPTDDGAAPSPTSPARHALPAEEPGEPQLSGRKPGAFVDCPQQPSPRHEGVGQRCTESYSIAKDGGLVSPGDPEWEDFIPGCFGEPEPDLAAEAFLREASGPADNAVTPTEGERCRDIAQPGSPEGKVDGVSFAPGVRQGLLQGGRDGDSTNDGPVGGAAGVNVVQEPKPIGDERAVLSDVTNSPRKVAGAGLFAGMDLRF